MNQRAELFVDCRCDLGEGPLWHPGRGELFWFDINVGDLYRAEPAGDVRMKLNFGEPVAAAAIIDDNTLLVASATGLFDFDIDTGARSLRLPLEAENPVTRSNDSRVSPQGAWWIGTMGRNEKGTDGALYHFRDGRLTTLRTQIGIPNSTCFTPDGRFAYFADTPTHRIEKIALDSETAMPVGDWQLFVDLGSGSPDGSVTDAEGFLWNAEYGASRVVRYAPDGRVDRVVELPCPNVTCPCFGGPDLTTLYITTASQKMTSEARGRAPHAGSVFVLQTDVPGLRETPVRL